LGKIEAKFVKSDWIWAKLRQNLGKSD